MNCDCVLLYAYIAERFCRFHLKTIEVEAYRKILDLAFRTENPISWTGAAYIGRCTFLYERMIFHVLGDRSPVYVSLLTHLDGHPICHKVPKRELGELYTLVIVRLPFLGDGVIR